MIPSFLCIHPIHGDYAGGRAPTVGALGDAGAVADDCMDVGAVADELHEQEQKSCLNREFYFILVPYHRQMLRIWLKMTS